MQTHPSKHPIFKKNIGMPPNFPRMSSLAISETNKNEVYVEFKKINYFALRKPHPGSIQVKFNTYG